MKKLFLIAITIMLAACASKEQISARNAAHQAAVEDWDSARRDAAEITCTNKEQCDRIFRIASDVVSELASMKIQTATQNYIATYNPIDYGAIGMTARRTLGSGNSEIVKLDVNCKGLSGAYPWESCFGRVATVYREYKSRIDAK